MPTVNPFDLSWALLVLFLASLPWFIVIVFTGLPRFSIAQIGWMTAIIAFGLAGPRLRLHAFYVLALVVVGSISVALQARDDRSRKG